MRLFTVLLDLLFPQKHTIRDLEQMSAAIALTTLPRNKKTLPHIRALFEYRHAHVRQLIWQLKYTGNKKVAKLCGEIMTPILEKEIAQKTSLLIIPIPLTTARRHERGFNQNELVIDHISKKYPRTYTAFAKIRHTVPQSSLHHRAERLVNLSGCFSVISPDLIHDQNIILVDDVVTTGSTLTEARNVLLAAGARSVESVVLAH